MASLTLDGSDLDAVPWTAPIQWLLAGNSLQLNTDPVDGYWISSVAQETTTAISAGEALNDLPAVVDFADGGWAVLYSDAASERSASGFLELYTQEADDHIQGCLAFTTDSGIQVSGAFSAAPSP